MAAIGQKRTFAPAAARKAEAHAENEWSWKLKGHFRDVANCAAPLISCLPYICRPVPARREYSSGSRPLRYTSIIGPSCNFRRTSH